MIKFFAGLFLLMLSGSIGAFAQSTTHTVQKGETLFSIAKQYEVNVEQIKEWNNIEASELSVGKSLIIRPAGDNPEDGKIHTVEKQETLFSISKMYNVSIAEIKSWNNLSSNNLSLGQNLTIFPSAAKAQQQSIVVDEETQKNTYYTVKSGDSLYRIAQTHDMSIDEIKELNGLTSNTIRVGQELTVKSQGGEAPPSVAATSNSSPQGKFISYEISGGSESLQDILEKFQMTEEEFRALNSDIEETSFRSGQTLTVLAPPTRTYKNPYLSNSSSNMHDLGSTPVQQYGQTEKANTTTNGELYNPEALTAAHSNISLGSVIYIENPENNRGVYVRINDRSSGKGLKLSSAAWQILEFKNNSPTVTIYQN